MGYFSELRGNARPLAAASIGLATGFSANSFTLSTIAPHMLADLGWNRAAFAKVTILGLLVLLFMPIVGRLADRFGTRATAAVGVVTLPLSFVAISLMTGDFRQYVAIYAFQSVFCITTTATVYSRVVAGRFTLARGLALAVFASAPALLGAIVSQPLAAFTIAHGWRTAFRLLAACSFAGGVAALLLIPREADRPSARAGREAGAKRDYGAILRSRPFWILIAALLLCNLPQIVVLSQLNIMLIDRGLDARTAATMFSVFALSNVVGRFACGVCLDRFRMNVVAAISMGVPAAGYFILAGTTGDLGVLTAAVFIIGLAIGAEGDMLAFITARTFGMEVYGTVYGLLTASIGGAAAIGSFLLGLTLDRTGSFALFLTIAGWSVAAGGLLFLAIGRGGARPEAAAAR